MSNQRKHQRQVTTARVKTANTTGNRSFKSAIVCTLLTFCSVSQAFGIPLSVLTDERESAVVPYELQELSSLQSPPPAAGDTAYALCKLHEIQLGIVGGSDCWGYTSAGADYAIMGINAGVVFVDAASGAVLDTIAGPKSGCGSVYWRDMATMGDYCYAVSECSGVNDGISVIDLSFLPDSAHLVGTFEIAPGRVTSHNLSIDSIAGYLYVEGIGVSGSNIYVHSLANPAAPAFVTGIGDISGSIHDMYAQSDTVYIAEGSGSSFSIWDITNKLSPVMLSRWTTPSSGYAHNIWPTEDHTHVITTEETGGRTVKIWDVSDYGDVQLASQYLAPSQLAHNAQVRGDKLYISHYESGVIVLDISDPSNPLQIAVFDTYGSENTSFNGAWGVYNFSPNGYVYASNVDGRLFILQEDEVVIFDSMMVDSIDGRPGEQVRVDVSVTNGLSAKQIIIPFSWAGSGDLEYSHISVAGLRTENFEEVSLTSYNPFADEAAARLLSSFAGTTPDLEPGEGPVLSIYFDVLGGAAEQYNPISIQTVGGASPLITTSCAITTAPSLFAGGVSVVASCCDLAGDADHSGAVTIGDATYLIARIFSGGAAPICSDEADADGSNNISIGDVTYLISHIFSGGASPICGSTGN